MGKAGALGDVVTVGKDKSKIIVTTETPFSKRYLKYLSKKYLKKNQVFLPPCSPCCRAAELQSCLARSSCRRVAVAGGCARASRLLLFCVFRCVISCALFRRARQHTSSSTTTSRRTMTTPATSRFCLLFRYGGRTWGQNEVCNARMCMPVNRVPQGVSDRVLHSVSEGRWGQLAAPSAADGHHPNWRFPLPHRTPHSAHRKKTEGHNKYTLGRVMTR